MSYLHATSITTIRLEKRCAVHVLEQGQPCGGQCFSDFSNGGMDSHGIAIVEKCRDLQLTW